MRATYEETPYAAVCPTERGGPWWDAARKGKPVTVYVEAVLEEVMLTGSTNYPIFRDCRLRTEK